MFLSQNIFSKIKKIFVLAIVMVVFGFGIQNSYNVLAYPSDGTTEVKKIEREISDQEKRIQELKEKAKKYQKNIEQKTMQISSLEEQVLVFNNRIAKKELDIEIAEEEIVQTKGKIEQKTLEIKDKETEIKEQKDKVADFIRLIYKNDQVSYLEVLILNDSFSDFFNYLTFTEDIQYKLKEVLDSVIALKEKLEMDKDLLEREKQNLEKLKIKLVQDNDKLSEEREIKEAILRETRYSESLFKRLLQKAKEDQINVDRDISQLEREKRKLLEEEESRRKLLDDTGTLSWPVDPSRGITAYFHDPDYPYRYLFEHPGIDLRVSQGTPLKSPANGYVGRARDAGMGYSYIMIIHDNGVSTVFGHVSKIFVQEDEFVTRGQIVGKSGGAPGTPGAGRFTTGAHLHFEVRLNGIPVDPLDYLP
ncbi:peptidoglycan DD-metalloendopeptidase family protein [Candidatus Falkowbacteria bacterium]|jgi:murein DD-endopeptidase MepM/ murein hydrolase activator NlpD|nr:peptidoglycan DD-metalloendopeptidase family protein [Candidatus Falkowbacteria bacterium]MBT4433103.1 peptidoglycan DD-metalloendopeptidase family protein [Candidatus Falkowbacteria bacterium]